MKTARLDIRLTPEDAELLRTAAEIENLPVTTFMLAIAVRRAHEVIEENRDALMTAETHQRFLADLDAPARSVPELVELFRRRPAHRIQID
jgi:uncharacterized protein (DUF1778 family)